ncbi:hypothetical protein Kpho01_58310 [Kitasatospora phosalacinea]|uniref:Uncharacterized protein n=1 Tax=Kitasatospora phosalacinea TaxID=2065 RepID=A0A9W6PMS1_9ACTN|nr:hypothetical protein Kpho01_58310 [Kitasatospora phosalacinea]
MVHERRKGPERQDAESRGARPGADAAIPGVSGTGAPTQGRPAFALPTPIEVRPRFRSHPPRLDAACADIHGAR